jgi:hypothetical protein
MSLFKKENSTSYTLVISLKSSSIDLQLIKIQNTQKREVVFALRHVLLLKNSQDPTLYTKQYLENLDFLLSKNNVELKKHIRENPLEIHFILYSPWFTSNINSLDEKESVLITPEFLRAKLKTITTPEHLKVIEKRVMKVQVNGYDVYDLIKLKAPNAKIDVYSSYIFKKTLELFTQSIEKHFAGKPKIILSTSPMIILDKVKEYMIREDNLSIICIGEEITDISIVKEDALVYYATFPIGKHDFLRIFDPVVQTYDYEIFQQKQFKFKSSTQEDEFKDIQNKWIQALSTVIRNFDAQVPTKLLVITDTKSYPFFVKLLADSHKNNQEIIFKNYRIINFDISVFKDIISYTTSSTQEVDLFLEALI